MKHVGLTLACRMLGVSAWSVRDWSDRGLLPCTRDRFGNRQFDPADLRRFAKRRAQQAETDRRKAIPELPR